MSRHSTREQTDRRFETLRERLPIKGIALGAAGIVVAAGAVVGIKKIVGDIQESGPPSPVPIAGSVHMPSCKVTMPLDVKNQAQVLPPYSYTKAQLDKLKLAYTKDQAAVCAAAGVYATKFVALYNGAVLHPSESTRAEGYASATNPPNTDNASYHATVLITDKDSKGTEVGTRYFYADFGFDKNGNPDASKIKDIGFEFTGIGASSNQARAAVTLDVPTNPKKEPWILNTLSSDGWEKPEDGFGYPTVDIGDPFVGGTPDVAGSQNSDLGEMYRRFVVLNKTVLAKFTASELVVNSTSPSPSATPKPTAAHTVSASPTPKKT